MRVGIIGGGLAGLTAAFDLVESGAQVILFNDSASLGGQIRTRRDAGFVIEDGAEGWVAADADVPRLCSALGIESELVAQLERRSLYLAGGRLSELTSGVAARLLGIQARDSDLGQGIVSLRRGMATLTDALAIAIRQRSTWRLGQPVMKLEQSASGWRVIGWNGESERVDGVVMAAPAPRAAGMIEPLAKDAAAVLQRMEFASNVSVSLGYERSAVGQPLDASGFVVDAGEELEGLRACAFSSSKFPGRAPEGRVLLRAFFRPATPALTHDERAWRERADRLLRAVLNIREPSLGAWVARWPDALPQYAANHRASVDEVSTHLRKLGRLEFAGSCFHPGGVPGAVRSGRAAARAILAS